MNRLIILSVFGTLAMSASAERLNPNVNFPKPNNMQTRAAGCPSANARKVMEFNNVSALLEQGGLLFLDRSIGRSAYEVPKGGNARAIYGNSLWMAGKTGDDVLKAATIVAFRTQGEEFWPGPLRPGGLATIDEATCVEYDKFYTANRTEVLAFYNDFLADGAVSSVPTNIANWPAFGPDGQALAPFYDADGDPLTYTPENGDMPWYQFKKTATELPCGNDRRVTIYGDNTYWWVFNDNGNVHTESQGQPIGMEIHAQAFAFNTDDEVNNMTFYNYELINRSTQTLFGTYFGNFFDCDLGYYLDDYTGCDVSRGLGYVYNGDNYDDPNSGAANYGLNPPAIGVDYFEGPYQDNDGTDNPLVTLYSAAIASGGIPYKGIGIGYGDGVVDNERFGMRKFMTYTGIGAPNANMSDPDNAAQAYNYLIGLWRDGSQPCWGGSGYPGLAGVSTIQVDYMYFNDTDPYYWASRGITTDQSVNPWREDLHGNTPGDRRFIESSGPFTLLPGAYNNITIGIVYARTPSGIPYNSVDPHLYRADDKAQALFDNCFKILEGPPAPDITIQELDNEIILMLTNNPQSTNYKEKYRENDPFIILPEEAPFNNPGLTPDEIDSLYRNYVFEGYKVFQLANGDVQTSDLDDPDKARLVAQVDIKNGIKKLINWERDDVTGFVVPSLKVDGSDAGVKHSFRFTTDAFTQGNLVNHKSYYYMAVAYAYNEYKKYTPGTGENGQLKPYIQSRKTAGGEDIRAVVAIPHIPIPENGGTYTNASYGDGPLITRIEGRGNGGLDMILTPESEATIVNNTFMPHPQYYGGEGKGPIEVKIIDPLNITKDRFRVKFNDSAAPYFLDRATWILENLTTGEVFESDMGINVNNEQVFPQYGFSITINQWKKVETFYDGGSGAATRTYYRSEIIRSEISFENSNTTWLSGIADQEGNTPFNWIRAGSVESEGVSANCDPSIYNDYLEVDPDGEFEGVLGGVIAPYHLAAHSWATQYCAANTPIDFDFRATITGGISGGSAFGQIRDFGVKSMRNIEIVLTSDKSKWTRCPVFETTDQPEYATNVPYGQKQVIKELPSRDKNGNVGDGIVTGDPEDADFIAATGMSWFPGYVIDVESGVRLNVGFGEDSRYPTQNGKDMMWNPTSVVASDMGELPWGGKHYLYIFANSINDPNYTTAAQKIPQYDFGQTLSNSLRTSASTSPGAISNNWRSCSWVWCPVLAPGYTMNNPATDMPCDARISIRVKKPYERFNTGNGGDFNLANLANSINDWNNVYEFSMADKISEINYTSYNDSILQLINVVPNPYYAYSQYEKNRLDNRIKIVNLPDECTIRIYNISGSLIRTLTKSTNTITSVDWDLKNQNNVPIAGGVYLIHVEVPGVGERVVKWFGALRPADLDNF